MGGVCRHLSAPDLLLVPQGCRANDGGSKRRDDTVNSHPPGTAFTGKSLQTCRIGKWSSGTATGPIVSNPPSREPVTASSAGNTSVGRIWRTNGTIAMPEARGKSSAPSTTTAVECICLPQDRTIGTHIALSMWQWRRILMEKFKGTPLDWQRLTAQQKEMVTQQLADVLLEIDKHRFTSLGPSCNRQASRPRSRFWVSHTTPCLTWQSPAGDRWGHSIPQLWRRGQSSSPISA